MHSYGQGIWIFHDHREKGITTNGMNPGGNVSALVYKKYLNEVGLPKVIGESIEPLFTKTFQDRKLPVWQNIDSWNSLGEVDASGYTAPPASVPAAADVTPGSASIETPVDNSFRNLMFGLFLGVLAYMLVIYRAKIIAMISALKGGNG